MSAITIKKARKLAKRQEVIQKIKSIDRLEKEVSRLQAERGAIKEDATIETLGLESKILGTMASLLEARQLAKKHVKAKLEPVPAGTMMRTSNGREYRILADGSRVREQPMKIRAI